MRLVVCNWKGNKRGWNKILLKPNAWNFRVAHKCFHLKVSWKKQSVRRLRPHVFWWTFCEVVGFISCLLYWQILSIASFLGCSKFMPQESIHAGAGTHWCFVDVQNMIFHLLFVTAWFDSMHRFLLWASRMKKFCLKTFVAQMPVANHCLERHFFCKKNLQQQSSRSDGLMYLRNQTRATLSSCASSRTAISIICPSSGR